MIRHENERRARRQMLAPFDRQAMKGAQIRGHHDAPGALRRSLYQARFAPQTFPSRGRFESEISCRAVLPVIHKTTPSLSAGKNTRRLIQPDAEKIFHIVEKRRSHKEQAVEPVEQAAVSRNGRSHIF